MGREERSVVDGMLNRVQRAWGESPLYQAQLKGPAPDRLLFHPADPYTPDRAEGEALLKGRYASGAESVDCEGDIELLWRRAARGGEIERRLHEFAFLRSLAALGERGKPIATRLARAWFDSNERWSADSWAPTLTGERLINLCLYGQGLIAGGDPLWRSRVLTSMARQTRHLARAGHRAEGGYERLMVAIALSLSALCLPACDEAAEKGLELLRRELRLQIRPDGGHVSRNPSRQLEVAVRLLMVVKALEARRVDAPGFLRHMVGRVAQHASLFRLGDGKLAVFNGGYEDDGRALASLNEVLDAQDPASFARHSGFQRLESGRTTLVADIGAARGGLASAGAFQGAASFNLSVGRVRLIVNCGSGARLSPDWASALRQLAAHSTLSTDPGATLAALARGASVTHRRAEEQRGQFLEIERRLGGEASPIKHVRRFYLAAGGDDLRGEDALIAPTAELAGAWRLRFHLHSDVKASLARDGKSVILALPNREGWRFRTNCRRLAIERSVYAGAGGAPQSTEQIVLCGESAAAAPAEIVIKWAFQRMDAVS